MRSRVVGLTGGIATGKSHVREVLESLGAETVDADRVAHDVIAPGGPEYAAVVEAFGTGIVGAGGAIDRQTLGRLVFADAAALLRLEAIVHPAVISVVRQRVVISRAPMVVIEAIKLLEAGLGRSLCDEVWVTTCRLEDQLARLAATRGMDTDAAMSRILSQMPQQEMAAQADRVIDTSGSMASTSLRVLEAWSEMGMPLPAPAARIARAADAEGVEALVAAGGCPAPDPGGAAAARPLTVVGLFGAVVAGLQTMAPISGDTAAVTSCVAGAASGRGLEPCMLEATTAAAREMGFVQLLSAAPGVRRDPQVAH